MYQTELYDAIAALTVPNEMYLRHDDMFPDRYDINLDELKKRRLEDKFEIWQLCKLFRCSEYSMEQNLKAAKLSIEPFNREWNSVAARLGSPYHFSDIYGEIWLRGGEKGYKPNRIADELGMNRNTFKQIEHGIALPSIETVYKISEMVDLPVERWRLTSYDLDAMLSGKILTPYKQLKAIITKSDEVIGPWAGEKKLLVRSLIPLMRLRNGIGLREFGKEVGLLEWQILQVETCKLPLSPTHAQRMAAVLGVRYWQDLYRVDKLPVNYYYHLGKEAEDE